MAYVPSRGYRRTSLLEETCTIKVGENLNSYAVRTSRRQIGRGPPIELRTRYPAGMIPCII